MNAPIPASATLLRSTPVHAATLANMAQAQVKMLIELISCDNLPGRESSDSLAMGRDDWYFILLAIHEQMDILAAMLNSEETETIAQLRLKIADPPR